MGVFNRTHRAGRHCGSHHVWNQGLLPYLQVILTAPLEETGMLLLGNSAQMAHSTAWWNILNIVWYVVTGQKERWPPLKSHPRKFNFSSPQIWPLLAFIFNLFSLWLPCSLRPLVEGFSDLPDCLIFPPVYSSFRCLECFLQNPSAHTSSGQVSCVCCRVWLRRFKSQLSDLLVAWLWKTCLTSLGLNWLNWKMSTGII